MKEGIRRVAGKILCWLTRIRNRTWEEVMRKRFGSIDATAVLEYPLKVIHPERMHLGKRSRISWWGCLVAMTECCGRKFDPAIVIGNDCYIGNFVHIVATSRIVIGNEVMLADRVYVSDTAYDYRNVDRSVMRSGQVGCGEVHIGDDSWIGENVCILGNVRIGRHCVVGSNAVVKRDLPSFSVAVGAPARIIKRYHFGRDRWEPTDPDGNFLDNSDGATKAVEKSPEHLVRPVLSGD